MVCTRAVVLYLVRINERLADAELAGSGSAFQVHAHEGSRHGRVAGKEQRLALLQEAREPVADRVRA